MNKGILAFFTILVILLVIVLYLHYAPASHITTTTVPYTTTANYSNPNITTPGLPSQNQTGYESCISTSSKVPLENGNFSLGTYAGWNATGGFGALPFNIIQANKVGDYYNHTWSGYSGAFVATTYTGGLQHQPGNLTSSQFKVVEPYLNFKLISPKSNLIYIEVLSDGKPFMVVHYNTYASPNSLYAPSTFQNASIPLTPLLCQNATVKVITDVVGAMPSYFQQYIAIGDFYMGKNATQTPGIVVNQTIV